MKTRGKRYQRNIDKVEKNKHYELGEAIALLKSFEPTRFDQTVEIAITLGVDPKKNDQQIRGSLSLPQGIGKSRKVIVFVDGEEAKIAKSAGADEAGGDDLIKKVAEGWLDFDVALTVPRMMKLVSKLGKILGPQGKMPSLKSGTVTEELAIAVKEFKTGKIELRCDANGIIHAPVGKISFDDQALRQNIETVEEYIKGQRPASVKGAFILNIDLCTTMSPSLRLKVL